MLRPNVPQLHVINHLTGEVSEGENRNVLVEAARICRGQIRDVAELDAADFDALLVPGSFGAAKNPVTSPSKGAECRIQPDVLKACQSFARAGKPAAYICIAPAMIPLIYGAGTWPPLATTRAPPTPSKPWVAVISTAR